MSDAAETCLRELPLFDRRLSGQLHSAKRIQGKAESHALGLSMRSSAAQNGTPSKLRKILVTAACVVVAITVAGLSVLHHYWPFTEAAVRKELGDTASASVTFSSFHDRYFPPGCAAEGVVFRRDGSNTPFITI